jgi:hypothetical protein
MKFRILPAILLAIGISIVTSKIVYFGFTPRYAPIIFSRSEFHRMFDHDVFKYRILSQYMLFALDDWMSNHLPAPAPDPTIRMHAKDASEQFYHALFYLNTFFLCVTAIILVLLLRLKAAFVLDDTGKYLFLLFSILAINLSQFVASPYDVSGYLFQLLMLYIFLAFSHQSFGFTLFSLTGLVFLSTLNRESAALSVALMALLFVNKWKPFLKAIIGISVMGFSFLGTYLALQHFITDPSNQYFSFDNTGFTLVDTNITGLFFWILFLSITLVLANDIKNRRFILLFHLLCLPYIIICFTKGVIWECRLYMPLFLGSLFLSKLNYATIFPKSSPHFNSSENT